MDNSIKLKILSSIFMGNKTYRDIGEDKGISPKTLKENLPCLAKEGLIIIDDKGWKIGKSKPCLITEAGINWLIKTSLFDVLKVFSNILDGLKKPENRKIYQKTRDKKYSQTIALVRNHLIERSKEGLDPFGEINDLTEWEYNKKFRIKDLDQILCDALKKLSMLIVFYWSDKSWEQIEEMTNTQYHVFSPRMEPWFSYLPGTSKKIDYHFLQIFNEFRLEMKSEQIDVKKGNTENE